MRNFLSILEETSPSDPGKDKVSQLINRIDAAISFGLLRAGEKLPSEQQLSEMLQVSVPTLREALAALRDDGVIETRRGRYGGSFLVGTADSWKHRGEMLLQSMTMAELRDLEDHSLAVFAASATQASRRGTAADFQRLRHLLGALKSSTSPSQMAVNDSRFHIEIAVISQSMHLTHAAVRIRSRLAPLLWSNPENDGVMERAFAHYSAVIEALQENDSARATELIEAHLREVFSHLIQLKLRALQRERGESAKSSKDAIRYIFAGLVANLTKNAHMVARSLAFPSRSAGSEPFSSMLVSNFSMAVLEAFPMVAGAGAMLASPPVPDAPECHYWWAKNQQGVVNRLIMDTTSGTDRFYDYQSMPWFAEARQSRTPILDGPYVDYLGYDQYIVTVSVPIESDSGDFLGIFGVDILVGELEKVLVPLLHDLDLKDATVVNEVGRVVVGGAPHLVSGELLAGFDARQAVALSPDSLGIYLVGVDSQIESDRSGRFDELVS
ncbi:GntR family transcriptional regulator [Arthrobacter ruber]|uniref:GntR family transcriptional regulator n=1 Tax=Arthrobacter ruber TaxID=1258893 RepID=UPI000CF50283|nr:GntR family transcriptional regulator [Arthrobacter ruber]